MTRTLYSRRNYLSNRGVNTIKDQAGNIVYILAGRWGMMPAVMEVYDLSNHVLAQIRQRSLGVLPRFELYNADQQMLGSIRRYYRVGPEIHFISGLNWVMIGSSVSFNYRVYHGRTLIMTITSEAESHQQELAITIEQSENEAICLCLAAILDFWAKKPQNKKSLKLSDKLHQLGGLSKKELGYFKS